jgi:tRNA 2-selenouridine synthase
MASPTLSPAGLGEFSEIIDARSPAEYAEDHIPGAINLPVLDNEERVRVGTLHAQDSAFAAKKLGAALVSRHIADYLESHFHSKPVGYAPLVYCWRGGNRSGSLTHVLQRIGFKATQLDGGYKAYRRTVIADLETLPGKFAFQVICGPTGCGKSRLLKALADRGAQVLDLEELAAHRGSLLGGLPGRAQPSQKGLESRIWWQLGHFDPKLPVYVESESKKIGNLRVPDALLDAMRKGNSIWLEASMEQRVGLLLEEYRHYLEDPRPLLEQLAHLIPLRGHELVDRWLGQISRGDWAAFVLDMLENHYDPAYRKSLDRNYGSNAPLMRWSLTGTGAEDFSQLATGIIDPPWMKTAQQAASLK